MTARNLERVVVVLAIVFAILMTRDIARWVTELDQVIRSVPS